MRRLIFLLAGCLCLSVAGVGQSQGGDKNANQDQPPPRSDEGSKQAGESSSRDNRIDLSPPADDAKAHPYSSLPQDDTDNSNSSDVQEFHTFDPHRASKDIEVGDFYFKKKNYSAALERYREALVYKPNDAFANFRIGQALEKLARLEEAGERYQEYLKIMPNGPQAEEAKKALEKIKANAPQEKNQAKQ
jgi:tetratricopeptide (TPR) repeat protein